MSRVTGYYLVPIIMHSLIGQKLTCALKKISEQKLLKIFHKVILNIIRSSMIVTAVHILNFKNRTILLYSSFLLILNLNQKIFFCKTSTVSFHKKETLAELFAFVQ